MGAADDGAGDGGDGGGAVAGRAAGEGYWVRGGGGGRLIEGGEVREVV